MSIWINLIFPFKTIRYRLFLFRLSWLQLIRYQLYWFRLFEFRLILLIQIVTLCNFALFFDKPKAFFRKIPLPEQNTWPLCMRQRATYFTSANENILESLKILFYCRGYFHSLRHKYHPQGLIATYATSIHAYVPSATCNDLVGISSIWSTYIQNLSSYSFT